MTSLEVRGLSGRVRGHPRVRALSFLVASGSIAAVFGRPDAGKRALLRLISGLDQPEDGEILVDGQNLTGVPTQRRRLGVVLRDAPMFPGTVFDNVVYGLTQHGWAKHDRERRVSAALELVGMTGTEAEPIASLNADERSRVALARALAPEPVALLLEAPTAHVDEVLKPDYRARLREVLRALPVTTLIFTDDLRDAVGMADDLHVLADGSILQSGPLSRVLAGPNSIRVAEMVGYVTLIRGEVDGDWILEPGAGAIQFPPGFPLSGTARAMAHPAAMLGVPESSGLGCGVTGMIERIRATGPTYTLDLRVGDRLTEVRWEWDLVPPPSDEPISIAVTPGTLRFFNETAPRERRGEDGASRARPSPPRPALIPAAAEPEAPDEVLPADQELSPDDVEPLVEADEPVSVSADDLPEERVEMVPDRPEPTDEADEADASAAPVASGSRPSPAPAPPRAAVSNEDSEDGGAVAGERGEDDSVAALAPWLQVSRPVQPPPHRDDPGDLAKRHEGMPLD